MVQIIDTPQAEFELGYWAIRGLAQPIRFLLAYAKVPFSEVRIGLNQNGSISADESADWESHKHTLGLAFPNLPYLIDKSGPTEIRLTQSNAMLRYLARRFDFYGDSEAEQISIDILQDEAYDFRNCIVEVSYTLGDGYPAAFAEFAATAIPRYLDGFESYLAKEENGSYFVGKRISLADFVLYELIWQASIMVPGSVEQSNRPTLFAFIKTFAKHPAIAAYMASEEYIERPVNMPYASFT
jgi:glutathione S-transferase